MMSMLSTGGGFIPTSTTGQVTMAIAAIVVVVAIIVVIVIVVMKYRESDTVLPVLLERMNTMVIPDEMVMVGLVMPLMESAGSDVIVMRGTQHAKILGDLYGLDRTAIEAAMLGSSQTASKPAMVIATASMLSTALNISPINVLKNLDVNRDMMTLLNANATAATASVNALSTGIDADTIRARMDEYRLYMGSLSDVLQELAVGPYLS